MATKPSASARPESRPSRVCGCVHKGIDELNAMHDDLGMHALQMTGGDVKRARLMSAAQWDDLAPGVDVVNTDEITAALPWSWDNALALAFTPTCVRTPGFLAMYLTGGLAINHEAGCPKSKTRRPFRVV